MDPDCNRQNAVENDTVVLNLCKKYHVPVVMDSDAHFDLLIGEFDLARDLLEKLDFPEELVLNRSTVAKKMILFALLFEKGFCEKNKKSVISFGLKACFL